PQLPSAPRTLDNSAVHEVRVAEQRASLVDAALSYQAADARAADNELAVPDGIDLLRSEPVPRAQRAQQREVAGPVAPEEEVGADPHFCHMQPLDQHRAHERLGIPLRQLV